MTEEEAKKKVCPYKIIAWAMNKCDANCEASTCMMWRWHGGRRPEKQMEAARGYCGLGGKL